MAVLEAPTRLISAEEFFSMPEARTHELIRGELVPLFPVGLDHGDAVAEIVTQLRPFVKRNQLGIVATEVGFILGRNPDVVRAPGVAFLAAARVPDSMGLFVEGAPDLAVEVVSPRDAWQELEEKVRLYFEAGTKVVWIVSRKDKLFYVRTPDGQNRTYKKHEVVSGGDLFPGFELLLADVLEA